MGPPAGRCETKSPQTYNYSLGQVCTLVCGEMHTQNLAHLTDVTGVCLASARIGFIYALSLTMGSQVPQGVPTG